MEGPTLEEARDGLTPPETAKLKFCFEQGTSSFVKVRRHDGWYIGVHMSAIPFMVIHASEGCWSIGRKNLEES